MLKIICGMVTQTMADSERFSIDFSFYKQRRVNFEGFFLTVCVCLSLLSKEKRKRNSKKPNAYSQFLFILKYIIIHFTKQTITGIIFSLIESHICLLVRSTGRKFSFQSTWDFLGEARPRMPGANAPKTKHNLCQKNQLQS